MLGEGGSEGVKGWGEESVKVGGEGIGIEGGKEELNM